MSNPVRPHRQQSTRLHHPWDSPGKNTGVGCYFLLQCMKVKSETEVTQSCPTLATPWTAAYQAPLSMGFSWQEYWSGVPLPSPSKSLPAIYFTYGNVHASMFFSQFVLPSPSNVSASLFSMSASPYIRSVNSYSPIILGKNKYSYVHLRKLGQRMCT